MRKLIAVLLAVLAAGAIATSALAGAPPVKHASVDVDGYAYNPGTIHIKRGTKVVWKWMDGSDIRHDIRVLKGPSKFSSKLQARGTFSHLFLKPGKYFLYCTVHPEVMRETVIVK